MIDHTGFESPRYQWESDTIEGQYFYDGVFIDTNKMFFLTISALYEYNGTNDGGESKSFSTQRNRDTEICVSAC